MITKIQEDKENTFENNKIKNNELLNLNIKINNYDNEIDILNHKNNEYVHSISLLNNTIKDMDKKREILEDKEIENNSEIEKLVLYIETLNR